MMNVHDRSGSRRDDVLHLQPVAALTRHSAKKGEALAGAVVDRVRIGVS